MAKSKNLKYHFDNLQILTQLEILNAFRKAFDKEPLKIKKPYLPNVAKAALFEIHLKRVKTILLNNFASRYKDISPDILDEMFGVIAKDIVNEMKKEK